MPSLHAWKSIEKAAEKGGYAGAECALPLWGLSKRELVEIVMRFGERVADDFSPEGAAKAALEEHEILKQQDII